MLKRIRDLNLLETGRGVLATATFKQSGITFGGTVINGALGSVFYILSARVLGPAQFGLMTVCLQVLMFATSVGDFGVDTSLVRFVSHYLKKDKVKANRFLKLSLKLKVLFGVSVATIGFLSSGLIAQDLFQKPELANGLRIAFVGVFATLIFGFVVSTLKSLQQFFLWSIIQIGANFTRVLMISGLFLLGLITLESALWTYALMLLFGFAVGMLFMIPKDFLFVKNEFSVAKELVSYSKWVASFTLVASFSSRLDTFISARLLSPEDLGFYGAASQLVFIVPQIIGALGTVIAPKMAEMGTKESLVAYLKKTQALVVGLALLGLLAAPVVSFFVPLLYGRAYTASIPIFTILLLAMLVFLISVPIHNAILYYFAAPRFFFWLSLGHILIMAALGWTLISTYGTVGAASTVLIGSIFNLVVPAFWVLKKIRV